MRPCVFMQRQPSRGACGGTPADLKRSRERNGHGNENGKKRGEVEERKGGVRKAGTVVPAPSESAPSSRAP